MSIAIVFWGLSAKNTDNNGRWFKIVLAGSSDFHIKAYKI
jgi:hypothetical protein